MGMGMKRWQIAMTTLVTMFVVLGLIGIAIGPSDDFKKKYPRNGLTEEQYVEIASDCAQNPDALRCK